MSLLTTGLVRPPYRGAPFISPFSYCNNGMLVSSQFAGMLAAQINGTIRYRRKSFGSFGGDTLPGSILSGSAGSVVRIRGMLHTGLYARAIGIRMVVIPTSALAVAPQVVAEFVGPTTLTSTTNVAKSPGSATDPSTWQHFERVVECDSDATYEWTISTVDYARVISACVYELALAPDIANGYVEGRYPVYTPIYSGHRQAMLERCTELWECNGAHVLALSIPGTLSSRTTATMRNALDLTSTTPSDATPGFKLDMRYKNRRSKTTVPCYFAAWAVNAAGAVGGGTVQIVDSTDTVLAQLTSFGTTGQWKKVAVALPAIEDKLDVKIQGDGTHALTLGAVSMFEYDGSNP